MTTVSELRAACRTWLDDPTHQPDFGHPGVGQDQYDLKNTRVRVAEVMHACSALMRNSDVVQILRDADAVRALLG